MKWLLLFSMSALAQPRTLTVSGQCLMNVQPDRGSVNLVAQFTNKSAKEATTKATQVYESLRKAVIAMKLKDLELQTSEYTVGEEVEWDNNRRVSRGMRATMGLQVITSDIMRLGEVIALTTKFEVNRADSLVTFLSREKTKVKQDQCLADAVRNARDKADKMATASSTKVGEVISIKEQFDGYAPPTPQLTAKMEMASVGDQQMSPAVESKLETISSRVIVEFALK